MVDVDQLVLENVYRFVLFTIQERKTFHYQSTSTEEIFSITRRRDVLRLFVLRRYITSFAKTLWRIYRRKLGNRTNFAYCSYFGGWLPIFRRSVLLLSLAKCALTIMYTASIMRLLF